MLRVQLIIALIVLYLNSITCQSSPTLCQKLDKYCSCKDDCIDYSDCCPSHQRYSNKVFADPLFQCESFNMPIQNSVWTISTCEEKQSHFYQLCANTRWDPNVPIINFVPVLQEDSDKVFRNKFCALCNGVDRFNYTSISVDCNLYPIRNITEANLIMIANISACSVTPKFGKLKARPCYPNLVNPCTDVTNEHYNNCTFGPWKPYTYGTDHVRNKYCCKCESNQNNKCLPAIYSFGGTPFSFMLNFNEWENLPALEEIKEKKFLNASVSNYTLTNNNNKTDSTTIYSKTVVYLSYMFVFISIIALSFLIVFYSFKSMFHNFGGYLTICLCFCLLIFDIILLIGTIETVIKSSFCYYIGIMQHFFLTSNFVWMSMYALDLLQTFGISRSQARKKSFKTFLVYFVSGFGAVSILVMSAGIADTFLPRNSSWRPRYGGRNCFFTQKLGGFVWFFLPVLLMLLWNLVSCVVVFYKLHKTSVECRAAKKKKAGSSGGGTVWLCARLTAVFGLGYMIQIAAISTGLQVVIDLGTMLTCLQGVLLAVCFFWAKRVRTAVRTTITSFSRSITTGTSVTEQTQHKVINTKITEIPDEIKHLERK